MQLSLPLESPAPPPLEPPSRWEAVVENYRATGINLDEHPMELLRSQLGEGVLRSVALARAEDGSTVEVAGLVVARQRPPTAKGITFMLLEDEFGTVNLVIPPHAYERYRALIRTAPLLHARGRLERREGVINVLVEDLTALERRDTDAEVRPLVQPRRIREGAVAELRAVVPARHSFGRRG